MTHVITQNIDNLRQDSGIPDENIIEPHGNGSYAKCLNCGLRYGNGWVREKFEATGGGPNCPQCDGLIKPATVSFGQAMPEAEMKRAEEAALSRDLFIAMGSSLAVFPAAGFPVLARRNGARLVIVIGNRRTSTAWRTSL